MKLKILYITLFAVAHTLLVYNVHISGKTFYEKRIKNNNKHQKIFDICHKYLPNYSKSNAICVVYNSLLLFPFFWKPQITYDFFSYIIPIVSFRYIVSNSTILPKQKHHDDEYFGLINILNGHAYDKLFSGHISCTIIISMILHEKNIITNKFYLYLYNFIVGLLILISRGHYTVDVLIGAYISITSYLLKIKLNFDNL
jgi:hypothetical protein